jgi:T5SS/PEP-CTERM-associated repeat protein
MKTPPILLAAMLIAAPPLRAQIVNDGATNTLSNVTNTITGNVTIGTNGSFTLLVLSDNALLTNSLNGTIGRNSTAKSNEVRLISSTARWRMGGSLFVGSNGASSRLVVSNGALLEDFNGNLGFLTASSNNSALVTGPGSLWTNSGSFSISGAFFSTSRSNQLVVSNSAALVSIGGATVGGYGNQVVVTGAGSRWENQSGFSFGGGPNRLEVSDGAGLVSSNATIADLTGSGDVTVLLTGTATLWTNTAELSMGYGGARGALTVSNGASLFLGGLARLGVIGGANFNSVSVTGPGTSWSIGSDLYVGYGGSANLLAISNGGFVVSSNAFLGGAILGASGNSALVVGAGSVWSNRNFLYIGAADRDNQLVVSNGATFFVGSSSLVSADVLATSNSVTVSGSGSVWSTVGVINLGDTGAGNRLVITNGGRLDGTYLSVGESSSSSNNQVVVTGSGSTGNVSSFLTVGKGGSGNRLEVNGGGRMASPFAEIGSAGGNNLVLVTDAGSSWTNAGTLTVGFDGTRNSLVVSNAAVVSTAGVQIGADSFGLSNRVVVDGGTLRATNALGTAALDVRRGTNVLNAGLIDVDQLLLTNFQGFFEFNGGTLVSRGGVISNGLPFVVGPSGTTPAVWDLLGGGTNTLVGNDLLIGSNASFNQLILTNGAQLTNATHCNLGYNAGANSNSATLANPGSQWLLYEGVFVGVYGASSRLIVSNGAAFVTRGGSLIIGHEFGSTNNEAVVTGTGSSEAHFFTVGNLGHDNRLLVSDGGQAASSVGFIGYGSDASNNLATLTGAGSSWSNALDLFIGNLGAANRLVVSNGAVLFAGTNVVVGYVPASTANRLTVDGGTLRATNAPATALLDIRRGTNVLNAGLIELDNLLLTNTLGFFEFNGGALSVKSTTVSNGQPFRVGNGVSPATLTLAGNGAHSFANGLTVLANGAVRGNGSLSGPFSVLSGGLLSPGTSIGTIVSASAPSLQGATLMEISQNGTTVSNDLFQVLKGLTYGGTLTVTNIGPDQLKAKSRFQLFSANGYSGSFSAITLPPLAPGLTWSNRLLLDGSIEILPPPALWISSGTYTQNFNSLERNGSTAEWRDNFTLDGWYAAQTLAPTNITTYRVSNGSDSTGGLYDFGAHSDPERALGSLASNPTGDIAFGLSFSNDTPNTVSNFTVTYTGEQWRNGSQNTNTLTFWYRLSASALTDPQPGTLTGWTEVTNLDFVSPLTGGGGVSVDGNAPANRHTFAGVLVPGLVLAPGQNVFFRWRDLNDPNEDQGLGVDDLTVSFSPLPQITSATFTANGFVQITGQAGPNSVFGIEAATNIIPPILWQRLVTNSADGAGLFQFTDTNTPAFRMRFYRAWVQ